jgi:hypothetical protein
VADKELEIDALRDRDGMIDALRVAKELVNLPQRRRAAEMLRARLGISQRRPCQIVCQPRPPMPRPGRPWRRSGVG